MAALLKRFRLSSYILPSTSVVAAGWFQRKRSQNDNASPTSKSESSQPRKKVAVIDDWSEVAPHCADWSLLKADCDIDFYCDHLTDLQRNIERLRPYDVIVCNRNRTEFDEPLLSQLPNLKLLTSTGPGNQSIDHSFAASQGITVCMTDHPGYGNLANAPMPTVQLAWAFILAHFRKVRENSARLKADPASWYPVGIENQPESLSGKTLGLIGLGGMGSAVARIALLFGMNVMAYSLNLDQSRCDAVDASIQCAPDLKHVMANSDVVVVCYRVNEKTRHMINEEALQYMKKDALLVNVSRGALVDEPALIRAVDAKQVGAVALDVFEEEPLPKDHPFRSERRYGDRVMISSHCGGFVKQVYELWYRQSMENIYFWLRGTPIRVTTPSHPRVKASEEELELAASIYE